MPDPLQPLEYSSPPVPAPRHRPIFDVGIGVICLLFAGTLIAARLFVLPAIEAMFRDFSVKLPTLTTWILRLSRINAIGFVAGACVVALLPPFVVPLLRPWPPRQAGYRPRYAFLLLLLLYLAFVATMILALFMPYVRLIDGMSGGAGKK